MAKWFWWHNFLTRHLVAQDATSCTPEVLRLGLASVTRYSVVLNMVDMPELSMRMAATCLGWNFPSTRDKPFLATSTVTQDQRTKTLQASDKWRAAFTAANTCDERLVQVSDEFAVVCEHAIEAQQILKNAIASEWEVTDPAKPNLEHPKPKRRSRQ